MLTIARQGDREDELDPGELGRNIFLHVRCPQLSCSSLLLYLVSLELHRLNKNFNGRVNGTLKLILNVRIGCVP